MINIKTKNNYIVALESVAMTDIVLTMFIFFFISFSLIYTFGPNAISKIEVKLPRASSAVSLDGSEKTVIAVTKEGRYFIEDEEMAPDVIKDLLRSKAGLDPDLSLILKVDGSAEFDSVAKLLDIINGLNIRKVSIAAEKED